MTMWYGGNGWGWCSAIAHLPSMVILWALVFAVTSIAVGFAIRPRHDAPARIGRSETDDDDFYRRLM
ncbi:hypothetical protein A5744_18840 [Mycobacterium sp. IS-1264]|nr:hypothetical protein A5744_18840 [Mycobacterium sp. IS-1264]